MKFLITLVAVSCTLLSGCAPMGRAGQTFVPYGVILQPNIAANKLDIVSPAQGWESAGKQNGWVGFYPGTHGAITFTLNELPSKGACTDNPDTSATWVITKIYLTKNGNPQTQKGNNFGTSQTGWIENAFGQMDPTNGEVLNVAKSNAGTSFVLEDLNNDNSQRTAYYQITAARCSDGFELTTDPGIGNGGLK